MSYGGMGGYGGDPFIHKTIGKIAKGVGGFIGGPIGGILKAGGGLLTGREQQPVRIPQVPTTPPILRGAPPIFGVPGVPPTPTGLPPGTRVTKQGTVTDRKRPRMNPLNPKALRRADRRIDAFVTQARRALKHSNYKIVSKSAGRSRRDLGPGHRHVR